MNCPICTNVALVRSERFGMDVDRCPTCRGVWLDVLALDRLTDRLDHGRAAGHRQPGGAHDSSGRLQAQRSRSSSGRLDSQRGRRSWWRELLD